MDIFTVSRGPLRRTLLIFAVLLLLLLMFQPDAKAWGRRGHELVNTNAAYVLAHHDPKLAYLKDKAYDLGYYGNVPDLIWKGSETYNIEWFNHFMDLEIFERAFKEAEKAGQAPGQPFAMDRLAFNKAYPQIPFSAGRAYWRIQELLAQLQATGDNLKAADLAREKRHALQAEWLLLAGTLGHYVADLGQPLHVTENYDGQLTGQKGVHAHYEDAAVDEMYTKIEGPALEKAKARWPAFHKANAKKSTLELLESLARESLKALPAILKQDKKIGREDLAKAARAYRGSVIERTASASLHLAEIWSRAQGWPYDGERFYTFLSTPAYVMPPLTPEDMKSLTKKKEEKPAATPAENKAK